MPAKSKSSRSKAKPATRQELIPMPGSGLDQVGRVQNAPKIIAGIQAQIHNQMDEGQLDRAFEYLQYLNGVGRISGTGQAAALWAIKDCWIPAEKDAPNLTNDEFAELVFTKVGYAVDTVKRYLTAWDFMNEAYGRCKPETWERLVNRNVSDLIALGQYVKEHGKLTVAVMNKLSLSPDLSTLRTDLRKAAGKEDEQHPIGIRWMPDGTLEAWADDDVQVVGYLARPNGQEKKDSVGMKALARIIRKAGIKDQA